MIMEFVEEEKCIGKYDIFKHKKYVVSQIEHYLWYAVYREG